MYHEMIEPVLPYHKISHDFRLNKDFRHKNVQKQYTVSFLYCSRSITIFINFTQRVTIPATSRQMIN